MEYRTFHLCDDASIDFYVGRIIRAEHEVKPELWDLEIGAYLDGDLPGTCYQRAA